LDLRGIEMTGIHLALLMQVLAMEHDDIFVYTQPNIGIHYRKADAEHPQWPNGYLLNSQEKNKFNKFFFDRGLWGVAYALDTAATVLTIGGCDQFDHDHLKNWPVGTADIALIAFTFMEIEAIHSWGKYGFGTPEVQWTFFRKEF
jgi:hypothetical protein